MDRDILPIIWDQCLDDMFMPPTSKNLKKMVGGGVGGTGRTLVLAFSVGVLFAELFFVFD